MSHNLFEMITRNFHPDAKANAKLLDLLADKRPRELIDGWPWHTMDAAALERLRSADYLGVDYDSVSGVCVMETCCAGRKSVVVTQVPARMAPPPLREPAGIPHLGHVWINLFPGLVTPVRTIFDCLWPGDAIRFLWYPDAKTNDTLAQAGLHGDLLQMEVRRSVPGTEERVMIFDLYSHVAKSGAGRIIRPYDPATEKVPNLLAV